QSHSASRRQQPEPGSGRGDRHRDGAGAFAPVGIDPSSQGGPDRTLKVANVRVGLPVDLYTRVRARAATERQASRRTGAKRLPRLMQASWSPSTGWIVAPGIDSASFRWR